MKNIEKELSGAEEKVQEYVKRIQAGESKEEIIKDLPPSFVSGIEKGLAEKDNAIVNSETDPEAEINIPVQYHGLDSDTLDFIWTIPEYIDPEKTESEKKRKQAAINFLKEQEARDNFEIIKKKDEIRSEAKVEEIRNEMGISSADKKIEFKNDNKALNALVERAASGRSQGVVSLFQDLLNNIDKPESKRNLVHALFDKLYNDYRIAEYPKVASEEKIWHDYLNNSRVPVNNKKSDWMYRGIFPGHDEDTVTRGSFNVNVTPELIDSLDQMILDGKIKANYKFGEPGTKSSPSERHDSISIYFLEEPSAEAIKEISNIIKPYVRGDHLLGKKIDDGFFMSEIGSIETRHVESFIKEMKLKDPAFAEAVRIYATNQFGSGTSLKMSEAQFYAVRDVAKAFGYNLSYNKDGFLIE